LTLSNTNTYAGSTSVNAGSVAASSAGSLGSGALIVGNSNTTFPPTKTFLYLFNAAQTVGPLSGAVADPTDGNTAAIFLSPATTLTVNQTAAGTFQGYVYGGGNLVLGSASNNTLQLSNNSIYTGSTTVNGGTIQLNVANALPTSTALTFAATIGSGTAATLNLNNNNQTVASLSGGSATAGFINTGTGAGGTLTVNNTTAPTTFGGVISGTGGLTLGLTNTQMLTLTGPNTYTGPTTVNSGTLQAGANWVFTGGVTMPIVPPFSPLPTPYPGTFTLANVASATLDLNNFNVAIGSLQGGGFSGGNITLGLGNGSFGSGGTLQVIQSVNTIYAGVISGNGNVIFGSSAGGTIFLVGHSTYNGNTYADITTLGNNNASPVNTNVIFGNTTTDGYQMNGFNQQVGSVSGGGPLGGNLANSATGGGVWTVAATTAQLSGNFNNSTLAGAILNNVSLVFDAGVNGVAQSLTLSGANNTTGLVLVGNQTSGASGAGSGVTNGVIVTSTSTFGGVQVGNLNVSNLVNSFTVASAGNVTLLNNVVIGDSVTGSTGTNTVTVNGVLSIEAAVTIGGGKTPFGTNTMLIGSSGSVQFPTNAGISVGVSGGGLSTLVVNGQLGSTSAFVGNIGINPNGVLAGAGTITANDGNGNINTITISSGGTLRGGVADGTNNLKTLTLASNVNANKGGTLTVEVSQGTSAGQANASLISLNSGGFFTINANGTGSATAGNHLIINLVNGAGDVPLVNGQSYTINLVEVDPTGGFGIFKSSPLSAGAVIPTSNYALTTTSPTMSFSNVSLALDSATGTMLQLTFTPSAVPEPEHIMLLCAGVLLVGFAVRRRWQKSARPQQLNSVVVSATT
jgi:fibronectin-binding autotransporter adhesin